MTPSRLAILCTSIHIKPMTEQLARGRPRAFDVEKALQSAMHAFWAEGFAATSYQSLENVTGLHRQSLIYAFGDKREMFLQALDLYARERVGEIVAILEREGSPLANVEAAFASWLEDVEARKGCLMVNTAGELGGANPRAAAAIARATERLRRAFSAAFERARQAGELRRGCVPQDLACLAVAAGDGALLHARSAEAAEAAARAFRALLATLR